MIRKPTAVELGAFIRRHRMARGMTQGELGAMVGLSCSKISDYENGRHCPVGDTLMAIFKALDAPQFAY